MKISLITVVYNSVDTLRDTIESVINQTYSNIEYIIIDGGSTDGTQDLVKSYGYFVNKFVSEPDNGLYDAINKGIMLATGEVVGLIHADDLFYDQHALQKVAKAFTDYNCESVYADLYYVDQQNTEKVIRNWKSGAFEPERFLNGWMPPHPTFYVKREKYHEYGLYDTDFRSAADYELMLRYLYKHRISTHYIPNTLIKMRVGGESNKSLKNRIRANKEDVQAWRKNNLNPRFLTRYLKPLRKIHQYILK